MRSGGQECAESLRRGMSLFLPVCPAPRSSIVLRMDLTLSVLPHTFAISRLASSDPIPGWATAAEAFSLTRTSEELSIVAPDAATPADVRAERAWRAFQVAGPIDLSQTGVLSSVLQPLADARIGIF